MSVKVNEKYLKGLTDSSALQKMMSRVKVAEGFIKNKNGAGNDKLGWYDLPARYKTDEYAEIKKAAKDICGKCDALVVIGIGGSYLGARAAIEFIKSPNYNSLSHNTPNVYFSGNNISDTALTELFEMIKDRDVCVNVISKSGKTTEPAIAFRIFREYMEKKYGKAEAKTRIYVTTDSSKGALKKLADEEGYKSFVVPDDIGGRYSVLTPVGLLPIAVAGCDIDKIMLGAEKAMRALENFDDKNDCVRYAMLRNYFYESGKKLEIFASYEPSFAMFNEWWKQLFGESEGKDGVGIIPGSVIYTTDLHSLGQMIQQGERTAFETVVKVNTPRSSVSIPHCDDDSDDLNYIAGMQMSAVNETAMRATAVAHTDGGVPNLLLEIDARDEDNFGYMVYFFELACAISGYILGVNPFDQPGVEAYKNNMFALLGRKGEMFDEIRAQLNKN